MEGDEDQRVIPYLMEENGVPWPSSNFPVFIDARDGVDDICVRGSSRVNWQHPDSKHWASLSMPTVTP